MAEVIVFEVLVVRWKVRVRQLLLVERYLVVVLQDTLQVHRYKGEEPGHRMVVVVVTHRAKLMVRGLHLLRL